MTFTITASYILPPPLYIFDLDGTLALIEHRRHLVENRANRWAEFYKACVHDTVNEPVLTALNALVKSGAEIWIFSGRSNEVQVETVDWLMRYAVPYTKLQMRTAGNFTPDDVLKKRWYDTMSREDKARLVATFDDRDRIVKMWRDAGVTCFQVAPGDF
jgi:hypothetical protein